MAGEVLWPVMSAALDEERDVLTPRDHAIIRARATGISLSLSVAFTAVILASLFVPSIAGWPTWAFYVAFLLAAMPSGIALRVTFNAQDAKAARRVHDLATRRRAEREAARTIPALGAGGDSVAVPGIVDDRVREARR
jgi:hypothetical protein